MLATPQLMRFRGLLPAGHAAISDYASARVFQAPRSRRRIRRLAALIPGLASWVARRETTSLISLVDTLHDTFVYGTRDGIESVAVPFSHLVLLSGGFYGDRGRAAGRQIHDEMEKYFGRYVDDLIGIRTLCQEAENVGENEILAFFGRGVFVPRPGEQPIGHVTLESQGRVAAAHPLMLAPQIPAAFYRGQGGVAFTFHPRTAPANSDVMSPDEYSFFYLGPSEDGSVEVELTWHPGSEPADAAGANYMVLRESDAAAGADPSFVIRGLENEQALLRCGYDARASRLHGAPARGTAALQIVGIVAPAENEARSIHRWWVDLDRRDRLRGGAWSRRASSILCEGDTVSRYDWLNTRFVQGAPAYRLAETNVLGRNVKVLRAPEGMPFGYLVPPKMSQRAVFHELWWTHDGYALDWLDFSGGIETWSGATRGLAQDASEHGPATLMPGLQDVRSGFGGADLLTRAPGANAFSSAWRGGWMPGTEFIVGPLMLRIPPE
ncbi:MAG: hypothetical protein E6G97_21630 [Alphaproteobacteria bacterium]|nr:MAG: hypothetical protein E6G97_21630 [Alphaproteobacteria bacterium]